MEIYSLQKNRIFGHFCSKFHEKQSRIIHIFLLCIHNVNFLLLLFVINVFEMIYHFSQLTDQHTFNHTFIKHRIYSSALSITPDTVVIHLYVCCSTQEATYPKTENGHLIVFSVEPPPLVIFIHTQLPLASILGV